VYVIDVCHYLDDKGNIGPEQGPARKMADFITSVIAHAFDFDRPENTPGSVCFKCRKRDNHSRVSSMSITLPVMINSPSVHPRRRAVRPIPRWKHAPVQAHTTLDKAHACVKQPLCDNVLHPLEPPWTPL